MSPDRANAYRRVLQTLEELGPTKLQKTEQDRIRFAADSLLFCDDLVGDESAQEAIDDTRQLFDGLTESGRWEQVTADRLVEDIRHCGPIPELERVGA